MARWFQYQAKTDPVSQPVIPVVAVLAVVQFTGLFQYQVKAEPVYVPPVPSSVTTTSGVTFPRSIIYQSIAYVPVVDEIPPVVVTAPFPDSVGISVPVRRQWQYQIKTEPVLVAEEVVYAPYSLDTNISYQRQWQYQAKSEPVVVPGAEIVTVDKWFVSLSEPTKRKPFINQQDNNPPLYAVTNPANTIFIPSGLNTNVKFKRLLQYQAKTEPVGIADVPPEVITEDKWHQTWSQPVRTNRFATTQQQSLAWSPQDITPPEVVTADKWFEHLAEPKRIRIRPAPYPAFVPIVETITVDKWLEPLSEPRRIKIRPAPDPSFIPISETITVDKWFEHLSEPKRVKGRPAPDRVFVPFVEIITVDKWFEPLSEPKRIKIRPAPDPAFVPIVEIVTVDKWFEPLSEPKRFKGRIYQPTADCPQDIVPPPPWLWSPLVGGSSGVRFQKTIVYQPIAEAPVVPPVTAPDFYPLIGGDTGVTFQKTIVYQESAQAVPPESRLFWGRAWAEPVRPRGLKVHQQQALAWSTHTPAAPVIITEESRWHQPWSEPVRVRRLATAYRQATAWGNTTPDVVSAVSPASISTSVNFPRSIIYQSKAWCPLPIDAPPQVIFYPFAQGDTGLIFRKKIIYQSLTDAGSEEVNSYWFEPLSEPIRQSSARLNYLYRTTGWGSFVQVPVPRTSTVTVTGQVVFPRSIIYQSQAWCPIKIDPEIIREDKWHQTWSQPVRTRRFPTAEQQTLAWSTYTPATPTQVVYFPYAEGDTGLIFRKKIIYQSVADAGSPETHIFWYEPWSEPIRHRSRARTYLLSGTIWAAQEIAPEVIREDKWHQPWSIPAKLKKTFRTDLQQSVAAPPIDPNLQRIVPWYAPWREPVRKKPGLWVGYQQSFAFGREIVIPPTMLVLDATETNNDTAFFAITMLYNRPVRAVVSIKEVKSHDDAYASIEET